MSEHTPTPAQQAIIDFISTNPNTNLMIDATAGAAKTSTMVMASAHIPITEAPLALAFNKRNAEDLARRMPSYWTCLTMNSLGHRAWAKARNARLDLDADKMYKLAREKLKTEDKADEYFTSVLGLAKTAKSIGIVPAGAPMKVRGLVQDHEEQWEEIAFIKGFDFDLDILQAARTLVLDSINLAFQGKIDFDDQIYMSVLFGGVFPRHPTVVVDESQDLSSMNHRMLRACVGNRLIAVGDPNQAIYAFRGADAQSMSNLASMMGQNFLQQNGDNPKNLIGKGKFAQLQLAASFRVPHLISARQVSHVPHYHSMPWLPQGKIERWPNKIPSHADLHDVEGPSRKTWSLHSIPTSGFVLCRNNAPLMRLAFALLKARRPVKILGRDIGASLATLLLKITGKSSLPTADCLPLLITWRDEQIAKAGNAESKRALIYDRYECLEVLLDASDATTNILAAQFIRDLFTDKEGGPELILSSGHRAKGLESTWVMHLDPFRVPSEQSLRAAQNGDDRALVQEKNLQYVIETRTQDTLVFANLEDCEEME